MKCKCKILGHKWTNFETHFLQTPSMLFGDRYPDQYDQMRYCKRCGKENVRAVYVYKDLSILVQNEGGKRECYEPGKLKGFELSYSGTYF